MKKKGKTLAWEGFLATKVEGGHERSNGAKAQFWLMVGLISDERCELCAQLATTV